ncbi:hypothetical protein Tco_0030409, partial [Tanacetum coccineum]
SGKSYKPPVNPNDQQNNSETPINFDSDDEEDEPTPQPKTQNLKPVKETSLPKPYKPKIPYPQRLRKEKMEAQYADLGTSINLMPYSLYAKLSLETLKFTFPADFVILEMEEDSKVPLILGQPFLHTTDAVIQVK